MHHNIVGKVWWEKQYFVAEIEVFAFRATPPARALVANRHAIIVKIVVLIPVCEAFVYKRARYFFVRHIVLGHTTPSASPSSKRSIHDYALS